MAASRCTPIANTLTQSFTNVAPVSGSWTATGPNGYSGRVDMRNSTGNVRSTVTFRNSGATALPAGIVTAQIRLFSSPGLAAAGAATPYSGITFANPLPAGWVLDSTSIDQVTSAGGANQIRVYFVYLRYMRELPAGANAPALVLTATITEPRPSVAAYGGNLNQAVPTTDYGSVFSAVGRVDSCDPATGAPTIESNSVVSSQLWGVRITRNTRSARTVDEQEGIQSIDPELTKH